MQVHWYFDFISPFAYFQCGQLDTLPKQTEIVYKPILFAGLLQHWGHKGPAEIPAKRRFTYRQALWIARRDGIPFRAPPAHPFNPLNALRLAIALDCDATAIEAIFHFIWGEGHRPDDANSWSMLVERIDAHTAAGKLSSTDVKGTLRSNTEEAIELGVFGVPTIAIDEKLFWGFDMTGMAAAYIEDPVQFEDPEMQRMSDLPIGVERRR